MVPRNTRSVDPITSLSATALAQRMRSGQLTPLEVIEAHLERLEAFNPLLNAAVQSLAESARTAAQAAANLPEAERGPLFAVPISVKDSLDVAAVRSSAGLSSRAGHLPERDATVVARLRAAGAIIIARSAAPDNCWDQETESLLFGRCNNPWDPRRSPGGSSGGEAALIAAGITALGIGTDIAGSIRLPAAFCGIAGLRPTSACLPEDGQWPPLGERLSQLEAIGPMARRVEDLALAFAIMRGADPGPLDIAALADQRIAFWFDDGLLPASGAVRGAVRATVAALERAGMHAVAAAPAARRFALVGWSAMFDAAAREDIARGFGNGDYWHPLAELRRSLRGQPRVSPGALRNWISVHYGSILAATIGIDGPAWRARLRAEFADLIGPGGLAVCPVFPTSAPAHGWSRSNPLVFAGYQAWVNLAGLPALALPVGRNRQGMPIGVQLVGAPGEEERLLAAGLLVQHVLMPVWHGPKL